MRTRSARRQPDNRPEQDLVGTFHRFGEHGVAYEVTALDDAGYVRIRVVESGERLRYAAANVRGDPKA